MLVDVILNLEDIFYKTFQWICEAEHYELIGLGIFKTGLPGAELITKTGLSKLFFTILKVWTN